MNRGAILVVLAFLLYSCGPGASASTPTPPPTASFTSSPSPSPTLTPTSTTKPKPTWTPKPPFSLPLPIGTPARKWHGITVMPGAIAGEELDPTTYAFTTRSGPDEIEPYMTTQMAKIGWHFLATGTGETGALVLFFTKGGSTASVSIIPVKDNQGTYFVLILLH